MPVHFTALGGFYRRRPKLSAGPCRTTPPSSGRRGIEQVPEYTDTLPAHLTALGGFYRRRSNSRLDHAGRRATERAPCASGRQRPTERAMTHRTRRLSLFGGWLSDVVHKVRTGTRGLQKLCRCTLRRWAAFIDAGPNSRPDHAGRRPIERAPCASGGQRPTERAMTHRTRRLSLFGGRLSDVVHKVRTGTRLNQLYKRNA